MSKNNEEKSETLRKIRSKNQLIKYLKSIGEYHETELKYKGIPIIKEKEATTFHLNEL
jgi:hypothetical protein